MFDQSWFGKFRQDLHSSRATDALVGLLRRLESMSPAEVDAAMTYARELLPHDHWEPCHAVAVFLFTRLPDVPPTARQQALAVLAKQLSRERGIGGWSSTQIEQILSSPAAASALVLMRLRQWPSSRQRDRALDLLSAVTPMVKLTGDIAWVGVRADPDGIGFFGFSNALENAGLEFCPISWFASDLARAVCPPCYESHRREFPRGLLVDPVALEQKVSTLGLWDSGIQLKKLGSLEHRDQIYGGQQSSASQWYDIFAGSDQAASLFWIFPQSTGLFQRT